MKQQHKNLLYMLLFVFLVLPITSLISMKYNKEHFESDDNSSYVTNTQFYTLLDSLKENVERKAEKNVILPLITELKNSLSGKSSKTESMSLIKQLENEVNRLDTNSGKYVTKESIYPIINELKEKIKKTERKCPKMPDMSRYILKTQIPEQKKCPKAPDMSKYVLKTNILPQQKCPDLICPKVKVSAGLCKKCPPPPKCPPCKRCPEPVCPEPQPCPVVKCPEHKPCPPQKACPKPQPCPRCPEKGTCPRCPKPKCSSKRKCSGCPYCQKSDGLLDNPAYDNIQAMRSHSHVQL